MKQDRIKKVLLILWPAILAFIFILICTASISYKSNTRDENRHLIRGVMLLETGDYRLNKHHPIFSNIMNAVPQLFNPDITIPDTDDPDWERADKDSLAGKLVDINGQRRSFLFNVLYLSRYVTIGFMALSGVILYLIVKKNFGFTAASIFTILYFFSPNIIAHSRLVTTDAYIIPLTFLGTVFLYKYLQTWKRSSLLWFIFISFLAILTKYSVIPVAMLWILILFVFRFFNRNNLSSGNTKKTNILQQIFHSLKIPALVVLTWIILLTAAYGFRFTTLKATNHANTEKTEAHMDNITDLTSSIPFLTGPIQNTYHNIPLPFPEYIIGFIENVLLHDTYGHDSFLWGQCRNDGWWYYFPVTMLIKVPVSLLIGIGALMLWPAIKLYLYITRTKNKKIKTLAKNFKLKPHHIFVIIPVFYFLLSMTSSINLGIRHILIIFPFIYLGIGILVQKAVKYQSKTLIPIALLTGWYMCSSISIYPHYLEYFNEIIGGPENGYKYLLDSNLSWAQDDLYVEDYINSFPDTTPVYKNPESEIEEGIVVIDVDRLMGRDKNKRADTEWLREPFLNGEIEPIDRIAYTYMVFEIKPE